MSKRLSIKDFPVSLNLPVQWGDMDAFQHVNNARFFRFFESARVYYFQATDLQDFFAGSSLSFILAKAGCTFIAPLTYPDTISVGCRTVRITASMMEQQYLIHSQKLGSAAALGTATLTAFDYQDMSRAEYPAEVIETICAHEKLELEPLG
ncbi:MAG: acyl-CoA thioesterase [Desulfovermiculus sp.]